jgi:nucleoside-diphosphate-sugar epimerase
VAVTGGSGRIGSYVLKALLARGHDPYNIDIVAPREKNCEFHQIDLQDREKTRAALKGAEALCHLAEIPNIMDPLTEDGVFSHNTLVGATVLKAAAEFKMRSAIYTSTCQVYGSWGYHAIPPEKLPFDETHPLRPQNAYSQSKVANEGFARLMSQRHFIPITAFRFPWVLCFEVEDEKSPGWAQLRAATGECDGFGTYLHAEDAAQAYVLALENPGHGFEAYHFVANDVFSAIPLAERLEKVYPNFPKLEERWPAYKCPVSTKKAFEKLGWAPKYSVREAHKKMFGKYP